MNSKKLKFKAFTLAEVLITLGVIGVVAAVTMPTLVTNIQERVRKEQVRTVKYKLTKATDKMNSLGKIGRYGDDVDATKNFVNELKKHLSIAKVCDSDHLADCWAGAGFTNPKGDEYKVADLKTGKKLEALQYNSGNTATMGLVTGDGTPIILVYGKDCQALDETKQYTWSTVDGKPETNATAGCVSMVFDINGSKGPNKLGTDVRTMNSLLGMVNLGRNYTPLSAEDCNNYKDKLGIKNCGAVESDYWAGAMKACNDVGMHLPSIATLNQMASLQYGITVTRWDIIYFQDDCTGYSGEGKCQVLLTDYVSPFSFNINGIVWSNEESTFYPNMAYGQAFLPSQKTRWYHDTRIYPGLAVCLAD